MSGSKTVSDYSHTHTRPTHSNALHPASVLRALPAPTARALLLLPAAPRPTQPLQLAAAVASDWECTITSNHTRDIVQNCCTRVTTTTTTTTILMILLYGVTRRACAA